MKLSLEEQPLSEDKEFEIEGIPILIHKRDYVYFDYTKLDYVEDVFGRKRFQLIKL